MIKFRVCMLAFCLVGIIFLGGCQKVADETVEKKYRVLAQDIPSPDAALENVGGTVVKELVYKVVDATIYRVVSLKQNEDGQEKYLCAIQILEAPYSNWNTYNLKELRIEGMHCSTVDVTLDEQGSIFGVLYDGTDYILTEWKENHFEKKQVVTDIWSQLDSPYMKPWRMDSNGNHYLLEQSRILCFDKLFQQERVLQLTGRVDDLLFCGDGRLRWLGSKDAIYLGVYDEESQPCFAEDRICISTNSNISMIINDNKKVIGADNQCLFLLDEKKEIICRFIDSGVCLDAIHDLSMDQEGRYFILADYNGSSLLITVSEGDFAEDKRKQVVIATDATPVMLKAIAGFNRENEQYYVTLNSYREEEGTYLEYCQKIQLENSIGKGPDIIDDLIINLTDWGQKGFLVDLGDECRLLESDYLMQAFETGKVDGVQYGIPISFSVMTMVTGIEVAEIADKYQKNGWTLEQFMQITEDVNPQTLMGNARAWDVLYFSSFLDNKSKDIVNWDQGTCYFNEKLFLQTLRFAKKYADSNSSFGYSYGGNLKAKERMVLCCELHNVQNYAELYRTYGTELEFIGFPSKEGTGTYINGRNFAIRSNSFCVEGAKEFLKYLLSEKVQQDVAKETTGFPVSNSALEIALLQGGTDYTGGNQTNVLIIEQQRKMLYELMENAAPKDKKYEQILNLLFEECNRYFEGEESPEEVAAIIQNRVQIYLVENRE